MPDVVLTKGCCFLNIIAVSLSKSMMVDDFFMVALDSSSGISVSTTSVSREILSFPMVTGNTTFFKYCTGPPFLNLNVPQDLFLIEIPSSRLSSKHFSQFCPHTVRLRPESKTAQFRVSPTNRLTYRCQYFEIGTRKYQSLQVFSIGQLEQDSSQPSGICFHIFYILLRFLLHPWDS